MSKRYDMCSPRPRNDKTFWHRVGTAFENEKGITLQFDSLPLPDKEGRVAVMLFEPKDKPAQSRAPERGSSSASTFDDEIPF